MPPKNKYENFEIKDIFDIITVSTRKGVFLFERMEKWCRKESLRC